MRTYRDTLNNLIDVAQDLCSAPEQEAQWRHLLVTMMAEDMASPADTARQLILLMANLLRD